ncbi:methylenetetrahydrofolate reductase [Quadrisphaera oryzae]|uniref:methylenetetrahydrofolate reductase n=1 Tax=Quadrisphaera TaxID=317661 RepID=UPI0016452A6C|nr:methylenetetrahydrofolate reductase [Quadrisphaera sp. RL12-1S]MBC3763218.1 methylenetetrahydrofolate reductase [Quadrisphaera sp. RL12-1S]
MTSDHTTRTSADLLVGASLEMTGKDAPGLLEAAGLLAPGTRVNVTYLGTEDDALRLDGVRAVLGQGLVPVPHIAARRQHSAEGLAGYCRALAEAGAITELLVVGGDPTSPEGPFPDALSLIRSGVLAQHGARGVAVTGYPDGHPAISSEALWSALEAKVSEVAAQGLDASVITQFGFDATTVLAWLEQVRARGIEVPVRVGVPGPAGVKRLLGYARRFGVGTSTSILRKYGLSMANLVSTAGPDRFVADLADQYDPARHGDVALHFYTFGGLRATAQWIQETRR